MNSDIHVPSPEDPEVRITALLLGELDRAAEVEVLRMIAEDPAWARLHAQLRQTIALVRQASAQPAQAVTAPATALRLSEERRERLLRRFKVVSVPQAKAVRWHLRKWLAPVGVAAALFILAAMLVPGLAKAKTKSQAVAVANNWRILSGAKEQRLLENQGRSAESLTTDAALSYLKSHAIEPVAGEKYLIGGPSEPVKVRIADPDLARRFVETVGDEAKALADHDVVRNLGSTKLVQTPAPAAAAVEDLTDLRPANVPAAAPAVELTSRGKVKEAAAEAESLRLRRRSIFLPTTDGAADSTAAEGRVGAAGTPEPGAVFESVAPRSLAEATDGEAQRGSGAGGFGGGGFTVPSHGANLWAETRNELRPQSLRQNGAHALYFDTNGRKSSDSGTAGDEAAAPRIDQPSTRVGVDIDGSLDFATSSKQRGAEGRLPADSRTDWVKTQVSARPIDKADLNDLARPATKVPALGDVPALGRGFATGVAAEPDAAAKGLTPSLPQGVEGRPLAAADVRVVAGADSRGREAARLGIGAPSAEAEGRSLARVEPTAESAPTPTLSETRQFLGEVPDPLARRDQELAQSSGGRVPRVPARASILADRADRKSGVEDKSFGVEMAEGYAAAPSPVARVPLQAGAAILGYEVDRPGSDILKELEASPVAAGVAGKDTGALGAVPKEEAFGQNPGLLTESAGRYGITPPDAGFKRKTEERLAEAEVSLLPALQAPTPPQGPARAGAEVSVKFEKPAVVALAKLPDLAAANGVAQGVEELERAAERPPAQAPIPQPEMATAEDRFSTFSLNVSDVSFKLAASSLENGVLPEPGSIRVEEFINAFDYHDPEPAPGVPIAFAWERAHYPFAHNRDLLRLSVQTAARGREAGRPLNLVLLLDSSGSMERADRVSIIREALGVLAGQLKPEDKISVVAFARTARLWIDGLPGSQAGELVQRVGNLTPEGGTNLEDAMNLAYQTAARHYLAGGVNRVVLLTDGAANLGDVDPDSLKRKVESNRKQGIALDCFGVGWEGYQDDLLEALARNGDGRYGFVNSPAEAASGFANQLAGALQVAASDVKVQVEFNPARVTAYRQLGYARHQLTQEQFRDNTVDAAEIGAAEAGNALYTIEVNPRGEGPIGIVRVRYKVPDTGEYREHEWEMPCPGAAPALERSSPAMRLAGAGAAFAEWLTTSPFAAEVTPDRLIALLRGAPEAYGADPRPKKLEWMIRQAQAIRGN